MQTDFELIVLQQHDTTPTGVMRELASFGSGFTLVQLNQPATSDDPGRVDGGGEVDDMHRQLAVELFGEYGGLRPRLRDRAGQCGRSGRDSDAGEGGHAVHGSGVRGFDMPL